MSTPDDFYLRQAAICAGNAANTDLPNLRDKYLRSQAAWEVLAARDVATRQVRERREADKAATCLIPQ